MPLPSEPSTLSTYGGEKADYSAPVDGSTDRSAAEINQAFADLAQVTRTALQSRVTFTISGGVATVTDHEALWGSTLALIPTIVVGGAGVYTVTLPASVTDILEEVHSVNIATGHANVAGSTCFQSNVTVATPNTFVVRVWDATGATPTHPTAAVTAFIY